QPLWSPAFVQFLVANTLLGTAFGCFLPTVPRFAADVLAASRGQIGLLTTVFTLSAVAMRPFAGFMLDTVGRRPVFLAFLFLFTAAVASYNVVASVAVLLLARAFQGLTWGVLYPATGT